MFDTTHKLWLPYVQMKTVPAPCRVVKAEGTRLSLDDGTRPYRWYLVVHHSRVQLSRVQQSG